MNLIYSGKTKDVYQLENGNYRLQFKDDMTGENGVFDPGANTVGLSVAGAGLGGLRLTEYFFRKIAAAGIPTHYVEADLAHATMTVRPATLFGKGMEVICRLRATGSFVRRYGELIEEGAPLDALVEVTLKDDERGDPLINRDALAMLGIASEAEYDELKSLTRKITMIVKEVLAAKGLELLDIKLEFGRVEGKIHLIDEISGGNMRVLKDGTSVSPLELVELVLQEPV